MELMFVLSEAANVFHVVNAISGWSVRCRPNIRAWYEAVFGLRARDREMLGRYAEIRRRYEREGRPESIVSGAFIAAGDPAAAHALLRARLAPDDAESLVECFDHFAEHCRILHRRLLPDLERRKAELEARAEGKAWEGVVDDLRVFFRAPREMPALTVHLILNTAGGCTGGYAPGDPPACVLLEPKCLGKCGDAYPASDFSIIAHEAAHLVLASGPDVRGAMRRALEAEGVPAALADVLEEAVIGTQFPRGHLAVKHGFLDEPAVLRAREGDLPDPAKDPTLHLYALQERLAAELYMPARDLLERGRSVLDDGFLHHAARRLKERS